MNKRNIILIIIALVALVVVSHMKKQIKQDKPIIDTAAPVSENASMEKDPEVEEIINEVPTSEMDSLDEEVDAEYITLDSVDPRGGDGMASRSFGETFSHKVVLNVDDPKPGKFYEGWLVKKPSLPIKFYSTGAMEKNEKGEYVLYYEADIDEKAYYNEVVITEETLADGLDNKPEGHIFEARFEE